MLVGVALAFAAVAIAGIASEARLSTVLWRGVIAAALAGGVAYMAGALLDVTTLSHLPEVSETEDNPSEEKTSRQKDKKEPAADKDDKKENKAEDDTSAKAEETKQDENKDNGASTDFKPMNDEGLAHLTAS